MLDAHAADCVGLFVQQQLLDNNVISEQEDLKYLILNSCHRDGVSQDDRENGILNTINATVERDPIIPFLPLLYFQ